MFRDLHKDQQTVFVKLILVPSFFVCLVLLVAILDDSRHVLNAEQDFLNKLPFCMHLVLASQDKINLHYLMLDSSFMFIVLPFSFCVFAFCNWSFNALATSVKASTSLIPFIFLLFCFSFLPEGKCH